MATILIVDDRALNRKVLVTLLGYRGHRLLEASDGAEALALVRAERPDLVIADVLMPTMDGYELVRQLRADPAIAHTRVIFCTAYYHEREARSLAEACGVAHVLFKPCEPEVVLSVVDELLGLPGGGDGVMRGTPSDTPPPSSLPPEEFDREHLRLLTDKLSEKINELQIANERLSQLYREVQDHSARLEEEVAERKQAEKGLQEAVCRRDEFLATLAHELRNPIASILNAAELMGLRGLSDPFLEQPKAIIERQVRHLARLLDDLLDVSRITRGKIELREEQLDLSHILADAVDAGRPDVDRRGHRLLVSLPPEILWVQADRTRMVQVLTNLLKNAAKYTDSGGTIWLTLTRQGSEAVIAVRDTGTGLAPELLRCIFDPFFQADRTLAHSQGGLGLGLTVAQKLVEMHKGSLTAVSAGPGQGSEFVVRLPLVLLQQDTVKPGVPPPASRGRRIVIVEDNTDAREMLRQLLQMLGHQVEAAADGPSGVEAILRFRPEVALIDIGLPGQNGYQVAQEVRAEPGGSDIFLVALTGYSQPEDRRSILAAGFNAHLVKPVGLEELGRVLAGFGA